jgi:hypothetical protein
VVPGVEGSNPFTHPTTFTNSMEKQQLTELIRSRAKDGKISCEQAHKIGTETATPLQQIGDLLNELKIKVVTCQLGCFP